MNASLLDVNVLIASIDQGHVAHTRVHAWMRGSAAKAWATCPLTQAGFVRIISNPRFHDRAVSVAEACELLAGLTGRPGHHFWPINISLDDAVAPFRDRLSGHKQVTDAYMLGLAIQNKGRLVTLDKGIEALAGRTFAQHLQIL